MLRIAPLAWVLAVAIPTSLSAREALRVALATPEPQAVVAASDGRVFVSGRAFAHEGRARPFDVAVVIDTSFSTQAPSNADVDADGFTGRRLGARWLPFLAWLLPIGNTDSGDSILAAEVEAARTLLRQLDPETTRVGVVSFSGSRRDATPDAGVEVSLSADYRRVERALDGLLAAGPRGRTNIEAGVVVAATELLETQATSLEAREYARKVMLFMTDGCPTLPEPHDSSANARRAIEAARRAASSGVRIDTFAIGRSALEQPRVTVEMAAVSHGIFTPVEDPRNLMAVFEEIRLAEIERVDVRNESTDAPAEQQRLEPDGTFSALVALREGTNWLEIRAVSTDGHEGRLRLPVHRLAAAAPQPLTAEQEARRTRLLENRLVELRRSNLAIESERDREFRQALRLQIEQARARVRRELGVEVDASAERPAQ